MSKIELERNLCENIGCVSFGLNPAVRIKAELSFDLFRLEFFFANSTKKKVKYLCEG